MELPILDWRLQIERGPQPGVAANNLQLELYNLKLS
jgi:hypothetical protein